MTTMTTCCGLFQARDAATGNDRSPLRSAGNDGWLSHNRDDDASMAVFTGLENQLNDEVHRQIGYPVGSFEHENMQRV